MGNSASSSARAHHDDSVDYGALVPQGVYTGQRDWNHAIVTQLIVDRKIAPFYRPLEEYEDTWDDDQILAARKELPDTDGAATLESGASAESISAAARPNASMSNRRPGSLKEPSRNPEAMIYRGATECPICFLYYPPNINRSRCCDQAICTECFVQMKRAEPTPQHLESEPAACPYCVQDNFGIVYTPPQWRAGIGSDMYPPIYQTNSRPSSQQAVEPVRTKDRNRRKSFGHDSPEVVTIDQIRPDWEAKLAAVKATVQRRANRRIIMRQVGDRLIPIGVTSGRIHPLAELQLGEQGEGSGVGGEGASGESRSGRRSRRRHQQQQGQTQDINQLLGTMGLGGQDLEEMMLMEAMRLSLIEHEEHQRKEAEKKKKEQTENGNAEGSEGAGSSSSRLDLPPIPPVSAPMEIRTLFPRSGRAESTSPSGGYSSSLQSRSPLSVSPSPASTSMSNRAHIPPQPSPLGGTGTTLGVGHTRTGSATPSQRSPSPSTRPDSAGSTVPRYSTLSAALASHSVASALLTAGEGHSSVGPSTAQRQENATPLPYSSSTPLSESSTSTVERELPATPTEPGLVVETGPVIPPKPPMKISLPSTNSITTQIESASYDELPSSPESTVSRRPLLMETPSSELTEDGAQDTY